MAKSVYKMPSVFIACPYDDSKFKFSSFKAELQTLPFVVEFANTTLETKHLLDKIKRLIKAADFSFFDLSMWNPNVSLELGLADGISASYYILINKKLDKNVPSDIQGIQRIVYSSLKNSSDSLRYQLIQYFFKKSYPITRDLWGKLSRHNKSDKLFDLGLRILAFLRDHNAISLQESKEISKGLNLRTNDFQQVVNS